MNASTTHLDVVHTGLKPSANLATEPALSTDDVRHAIKVGTKLAATAKTDGITILAGGEMGIGNTTPATALACWLTGGDPAELAGPGTGLDPAGVRRKAQIIARALDRDDPRHPSRPSPASAAARSRSSPAWHSARAGTASATCATA